MEQINTWQGTVTQGLNIGHTIGFPTANLDQVPNEDQLKPGVYLGKCQIQSPLSKEETSSEGVTEVFNPISNLHNCLIYFGPKLVLNEVKNVFEVFIIDFDQELYGKTLKVEPIQYIRHPIKFNSIEELKNQLELDLETALQLIQKI